MIRVLAIDFGSKYTSIFHCLSEEENKDEKGSCLGKFKGNKHTQTLFSENYKAHIAFLLNWIRRLNINYVVYEATSTSEEKIETRSDRWMWDYWKILDCVISYCQKNKIAGLRITPWEVKHYRNNKCSASLKWDKTKQKHLCSEVENHKSSYRFITEDQMKEQNITSEEAKFQGYQFIGEKARNELDAKCLWEIWNYHYFLKTNYLKIRQELHWKKLRSKAIPNRQITKAERIIELWKEQKENR